MSSAEAGATSNNNNRERWENRTAFILASIGAAVGFGNVWRFPSLVYEYGGAVFFIPYLLALVLIGIPLLVQEIALGQHLQSSEVTVNHYMNKHTKGVGVGCVVSGLMVAMYYVPIISWCIRSFCESFGGNIRNNFGADADNGNIYGSDASSYFFHNVIGQYTLDEEQKPTRIVWLNVGYLAVTWIIVGMCIAFGLKWTGRVAYITMGMPILMLFILLIRSTTLPGSSDGVHRYFGEWDTSLLIKRPDIWSTAVSQIFFSIGIAFGVMTAFGSYCDRNAPAVENSFIIAIANSTFSIISGVCTFAVIGYMTSEIEGDFRVYAGPSLLFGAYPAALSTIPGGIHWVRFLFLNLILLGLDSCFALIEGVTTMINDSPYVNNSNVENNDNNNYKRRKMIVVTVVCVVGFCGGLLYTTDAGLLFMDTVDFYINFAVLFLGFCKSLSSGWIYGMKKQVSNLGEQWNIVYMYFGTTFSSFLLASLVWFGVKGDNTFWLGLICLIVVYGSGTAYCLFNLKHLVKEDKSVSMRFLRNELLMGNVLELRKELESSIGYLPWIWAFLMKHFIPQALMMLFFNLFFAETDYGYIEFGNYNGYRDWPYQVVGVGSALFVFGIVFIGVLNHKIFNFLTDPIILNTTRTAAGDDDDDSGYLMTCGGGGGDNNNNNKDWVDVGNSGKEEVEMKDKTNSLITTRYKNMENLETNADDDENAKATDAVMA